MTNEDALVGYQNLYNEIDKNNHLFVGTINPEWIQMAIKALEQPQIIRCKDCKWSDWYTAGDGKKYCYCMETGMGGRTENDYCSYAERRKEE